MFDTFRRSLIKGAATALVMGLGLSAIASPSVAETTLRWCRIRG